MPCGCPTVCTVRRRTCAAPKGRPNGKVVNRIDPSVLAPLPIFDGIAPEAIADLLADATAAVYPRQTLLFSAGNPAECFFIVLGGRVKLFALTEDGKESIVEIFAPVSSFAEAAMFASGSFPLSAEVVEDAALIRVGAASFLKRLQQDRALAFKMLAALARWNRRLTSEIRHLKLKTPAQRVVEFLLSLTDEAQGEVVVALPFKKGLLASRVGIGRESFSRVLSRLRRVGVETIGNTVRIADIGALRRHCAEGSLE